MKFAFERRQTTRTVVYVNAGNETAAWEHVLSGLMPDEASDPELMRLPVFKRLPDQDDLEYDL